MTTYYIYWDLIPLNDIFKPMTDDLFEERFEEVTENNVYALNFLGAPGIYQIYGWHPAHGPETLLYIGATHRTMLGRLLEHLSNKNDDRFILDEQDVKFRCGRFMRSMDDSNYINLEDASLTLIEKTLIAVCTPPYNTQHINFMHNEGNIRIFNSGQFGAMPGEISSR